MPLALAPEVGDLAVVVVALVAIMLLFASRLLAQLLVGLLRFLPLVGDWIADHLLDHVVDALDWALGAVAAAIPPLVGFLWRPIAWFIQIVGDTVSVAEGAAAAMIRFSFVTLPQLEFRAIGYAEDAYARATTYALGQVVAAERYALTLQGEAVAFAAGEVVNAEHYSLQLYGDAVTYVDGRIAQVVTWARGDIGAVYSYVDGRVIAVESWARGEFDAVRTWAMAEFATLEGAIARDIGVVEQGARELVNAAEARAAAFAAAAAAGVAAEVGVVERTLDDFLRRCGDPMCRNLGPLSDLFGLLEDAGTLGLIVAFAAAAAANPEGVAGEVVDVLGTVVNDAVSTVESLIGAAA